LRVADRADSHSKTTWEEVLITHESAIDKALARVKARFPVGGDKTDALKELIARDLISTDMSSALTGLVVAGYGKDGLFPALVQYEIDGFVLGRLRYSERERVDIANDAEPVKIITFAQTDISSRFLDGIDPDMVTEIEECLLGGLGEMRDSMTTEGVTGGSRSFDDSFDACGQKLLDLVMDTLEDLKEKNNREFKETVSAMPKQEMAYFAEALVNTTSMKHRVSSQRETVGGPVDVAVISRHDGFVWVKRKHYFEGDLNPRYFERKFKRKSSSTPRPKGAR
jgi:hypothetical protein